MGFDRRVSVFLALIATGVTAWFCPACSDAPPNPEAGTLAECGFGDMAPAVPRAAGGPPDGTSVHAAAGDAKEGDAPRGEELLGSGFGEFIFIRGGEFTMGRNQGEHKDQRPEHRVELSSFYIGRTPVTTSQFVHFLNDAGVEPEEYLYSQMTRGPPSVSFVDGRWSSAQGAERDAACVQNWDLAERYCEWLSRKGGGRCRLPTEAEWEYVCRGKEGRMFPWGDDMDDLGDKVWRWRGWSRTKPKKVPVGSFPKGATPEGVCDLIGYMDELCSDWYDPDYYSRSPRKDPQGPEEPVEVNGAIGRVKRGGLEHRYGVEGITGYFRVSRYFGVLPSTFLPRGWSRSRLSERVAEPRTANRVYGRIGLRVVVECTVPPNPSGL